MTAPVSLTAHKGQRDDAMARVQAQVVQTAVAQVTAHMETDAMQQRLIAAAVREATDAVRKANDAVLAEERRIGRAHGWRGAAGGALVGAAAAIMGVWFMLGGLTNSVAFFAKVQAAEERQQELDRELSERIAPP